MTFTPSNLDIREPVEPGSAASHNHPVESPPRPAAGSKAPKGRLTSGYVAPQAAAPAHIERPDYVGKKDAVEGLYGDVYDADGIAKIRAASRLAAEAMNQVEQYIQPGITTAELDRIGHEFIVAQDAWPSTLGYKGFSKSMTTSLNEVICHGIPDDTVLEDGDIINIDITVYKNGHHGDHNKTFFVGTVDEQSRLLVERTEKALERAIKAVKPGREINVIGRVIETYAKRFGYGVVEDFVGHGVGREFHSGLIIPHYDTAPRHNEVMVPGMVFTIEPMLTLGGIAWDMWDDGWTVTTKDKQRSAQFEHTIVVTSDGAEILTVAD